MTTLDHSDPGGVRGPAYATIPEWVLDAPISATAVRLFAVLTRYVGTNDAAWPSRKTMAGRLHLSPTTLDRALVELTELGAIIMQPRYRSDGSQTSSLYYLWPSTPDSTTDAPHPQERRPPSPSADTPPSPQTMTLEVTPMRKNPKDRTPSNARRDFEVEVGFDASWDHYPRKVNRKGALRAWIAQCNKGATVEALSLAVLHYAMSMEGKEPTYIMHGATFFGPNDRWQDYLEEPILDRTNEGDAGWALIMGKVAQDHGA